MKHKQRKGKYLYQRGLTVDNNLPFQELRKELKKIGVFVDEDSLLNLMVHMLKPQIRTSARNIIEADNNLASSLFSKPSSFDPISRGRL